MKNMTPKDEYAIPKSRKRWPTPAVAGMGVVGGMTLKALWEYVFQEHILEQLISNIFDWIREQSMINILIVVLLLAGFFLLIFGLYKFFECVKIHGGGVFSFFGREMFRYDSIQHDGERKKEKFKCEEPRKGLRTVSK